MGQLRMMSFGLIALVGLTGLAVGTPQDGGDNGGKQNAPPDQAPVQHKSQSGQWHTKAGRLRVDGDTRTGTGEITNLDAVPGDEDATHDIVLNLGGHLTKATPKSNGPGSWASGIAVWDSALTQNGRGFKHTRYQGIPPVPTGPNVRFGYAKVISLTGTDPNCAMFWRQKCLEWHYQLVNDDTGSVTTPPLPANFTPVNPPMGPPWWDNGAPSSGQGWQTTGTSSANANAPAKSVPGNAAMDWPATNYPAGYLAPFNGHISFRARFQTEYAFKCPGDAVPQVYGYVEWGFTMVVNFAVGQPVEQWSMATGGYPGLPKHVPTK